MVSTLPQKASELLTDIFAIIGPGWPRLLIVGALMLSSTALDVLGVALVATFLSITVTLQDSVPVVPRFLKHFVGTNVVAFGLILLAVFLIKAYMAYRVQRSITQATESERARLMMRLLAAYQAQPYEIHLSRNSSELINLVVLVTESFASGLLATFLQLIANSLVFLALAVYLALSNFLAFILLVVLLLCVFVTVTRSVRPRLAAAAESVAKLNADAMHTVTEALGALREVRILGRETYFRDRLRVAADELVKSTAALSSLQLVPRHAIEATMAAFLVALAWLAQHQQTAALIPLLGTFGAAASRLMPASTSLLSNWNIFRANRFAVRLLRRELAGDCSLSVSAHFHRSAPVVPFQELVVERATYAYPHSHSATLSSLSLRIQAGEVVGLIGRSGSGKSTLADVILGLLKPRSGVVLVNSWDIHSNLACWHRMTAYIPQTVYLLDDSLTRNIALGVLDAEIDNARLLDAVRQAHLIEVVNQLPQGLETQIGEQGARLSGGQRQRVALARALYHDRQFLILDEATSALDEETERDVVTAIAGLAGQKTILVIAHHKSTLAACNRLLRLHSGTLLEQPNPAPGSRGQQHGPFRC